MTKLSAARNSDYGANASGFSAFNPDKKVQKVRQINEEEWHLRRDDNDDDDDDDDDDNHFCGKADCIWKDGAADLDVCERSDDDDDSSCTLSRRGKQSEVLTVAWKNSEDEEEDDDDVDGHGVGGVERC